MKRMKKTKLAVVLMLVLLCAVLLMGFDSEQQKVYDDTGKLTNSEKSELQQLCVETAQLSQTDIAVVIINNAEGKTAVQYAEDFFTAHGFGYNKNLGDGVLFLVDLDNKEVRIVTSGKAIKFLSDTRITKIINDATTLWHQGNYMDACKKVVNEVGIAGQNYYKTIPQKLVEYLWLKILIAVAVGGIVVLIMMHNAKAKMTVGSQTYVKDHKFDVRDRRDQYTNTTVVKHKIQTNKGGGGSSHIGSGGNTFGGGGGRL